MLVAFLCSFSFPFLKFEHIWLYHSACSATHFALILTVRTVLIDITIRNLCD